MPSLRISCEGCKQRVRVPATLRRGKTLKAHIVKQTDFALIEKGHKPGDTVQVQKNPSGRQVVGPRYKECRRCFKARTGNRRPSQPKRVQKPRTTKAKPAANLPNKGGKKSN